MSDLLDIRHRSVDPWEFRERMFAKAEEARRHAELNRAATIAAHQPPREPRAKAAKPKPKPQPRERNNREPRTPRPAAVRPCITCGHMTRSNNLKATDYPGTRPRQKAGQCSTCAEKPSRPRTGVRTPRVTETESDAWFAAYMAGTSAADIARQYGRNQRTVRDYLRRRGVQIARANQQGRAA